MKGSRWRLVRAAWFLLPLATSLAWACRPGEEFEEIAHHLNCDLVCDWAIDCGIVQTSFDACDDPCEDNADDSEFYESDLERCAGCVDDTHDELSCSDSRRVCADECEDIFPTVNI
ncbi:MAG: hypothetical protein HOW73_04730 [Polyangiaceae bacterium]|nr:hypothetical protein [Polyangiaceae bacterium]